MRGVHRRLGYAEAATEAGSCEQACLQGVNFYKAACSEMHAPQQMICMHSVLASECFTRSLISRYRNVELHAATMMHMQVKLLGQPSRFPSDACTEGPDACPRTQQCR